MRQSLLGSLVARFYSRLPLRHKMVKIATRLEGGELYSQTLRKVLAQNYGVIVGNYSYGSLLRPGMADRFTTIGNYVSVGPNVRRFGASHPLSELSLHPFWYNPKLGYVSAENDVQRGNCDIGDDVWIGANVVILPGCQRIGVGAVIGAGSVVTRDVPDFAVVAGNPARQISSRLSEEVRVRLKQANPWALGPREAHSALQEIESEYR